MLLSRMAALLVFFFCPGDISAALDQAYHCPLPVAGFFISSTMSQKFPNEIRGLNGSQSWARHAKAVRHGNFCQPTTSHHKAENSRERSRTCRHVRSPRRLKVCHGSCQFLRKLGTGNQWTILKSGLVLVGLDQIVLIFLDYDASTHY